MCIRDRLDPENRKYKFNGEVNATSGVFKNIKSPNDSFRIKENGEIEIVGKVSTSSNGTRIEIDPATNSLKMYTKDYMEVAVLSFFEMCIRDRLMVRLMLSIKSISSE